MRARCIRDSSHRALRLGRVRGLRLLLHLQEMGLREPIGRDALLLGDVDLRRHLCPHLCSKGGLRDTLRGTRERGAVSLRHALSLIIRTR